MTPIYARRKRTTLAIATTVAAGALLATGLTTGAAALPDGKTAPLAGSPLQLSNSARAALIQKADAATAETARRIGLGTKEKLVVRDVIKDVDGTVHTRYERTYNGLPVLGGDLVVHENKAGTSETVTKAIKAAIKVASLKPVVTT
ncbi:peptidase M4 family protein, partial [Streptomyces sp. NPDC056121]